MGRFDTTKATINANIKSNGNQEITGSVLNSVLQEMVDGTDAQLTELSKKIKSISAFVECTTPSYTAIKDITLDGFTGQPIRVCIQFSYAGFAENQVIRVNWENSYPMMYNWGEVKRENVWVDGQKVDAIFDGNTFYLFSLAEEIHKSSYTLSNFEQHTLNASDGTPANNYASIRSADFIPVTQGKYQLDFSWSKTMGWTYWFGYKDGVFVKRDIVGSAQNVQSALLTIPEGINQIKIQSNGTTSMTEDDAKNTSITISTLISHSVKDAYARILGLAERVEEIEQKNDAPEEDNAGEVAEQIVNTWEVGTFNATDGSLANNYNALRTADFIPVTQGKYQLDFSWSKDVLWTYWFGYKDGVFVKRDTVGYEQNIQSAELTIPVGINQIKIQANASTAMTEEDVKNTSLKLISPIDMAVNVLITRVDALKNAFNLVDKTDLATNVGFVAASGYLSTSSAYRYTNPIKVEKGDIYYIETMSTTSVMVVSDAGSATITPPLKLVQRGDNARTSYVYAADKSGYVVFSILYDGTIHKIEDGLLPSSILIDAPSFWLANIINARVVSVKKPNLNIAENYLSFSEGTFILTNNRLYELDAIFANNKDAYKRIPFNGADNSGGLQILTFNTSTGALAFQNFNAPISVESVILGYVSKSIKTGDVYSLNAHYFSFDYTIDGYDANIKDIAQIANTSNNNALCDIANPYIYHYFMTGFDANTLPTIAGQSLEDIAIARRLGFKVIEANVHKTSDNKYVVLHGAAGKLGYLFEDNNGNLANEVVIGEKTLAELQSNYRYRSQYPQYKTRMPSLEEFLRECKRQGMSVYVQYVDDTEMGIVERIMGGHNYIQSFGTRKNGSYTAAYSDYATLLQKVQQNDSNYMAMMDNALVESLIADGTLAEKIDEIHSYGKMVGYPSSYATEVVNQQTIAAGMDFSVAAYQVNDFRNGNLFSEVGENADFSMFSSNGVTANGALSLQNGQYVEKVLDKAYFLSKSSLHIRFKGTIKLTLGSHIQAEQFTSDGKSDMFFSTYYLEQIPSMRIESVGATEIVSIALDMSRC